jgi:hypothetical protein
MISRETRHPRPQARARENLGQRPRRGLPRARLARLDVAAMSKSELEQEKEILRRREAHARKHPTHKGGIDAAPHTVAWHFHRLRHAAQYFATRAALHGARRDSPSPGCAKRHDTKTSAYCHRVRAGATAAALGEREKQVAEALRC